jgi:hypothetical protein
VVNAPKGIKLNGETTITQNLKVDQAITANKDITARGATIGTTDVKGPPSGNWHLGGL